MWISGWSAKNRRSAKSSRSMNATWVLVLSKLKYILSESLIFSRASVTSKLIYLKYYGGFARQPKMHESTCVYVTRLASLFLVHKAKVYRCMCAVPARSFFPVLHHTPSSSFSFIFLRKWFYYASEIDATESQRLFSHSHVFVLQLIITFTLKRNPCIHVFKKNRIAIDTTYTPTFFSVFIFLR